MTLRWSCPDCIGHLLFPMGNDLPRPRRNMASSSEVFPESWSPQPGLTPGGISSAACSMHRRPVTVSSVKTMGPHPADPDLGVTAPYARRVPHGTRGGSCSEMPGPIAAAPIRPFRSTWNPSSGLPSQPGRGPPTIDGPRCLGKSSLTAHFRPCGESAGFAAPPEADHGGDQGHANATHFGSALSGGCGCALRGDRVPKAKAATGAQASRQGLWRLTAPV